MIVERGAVLREEIGEGVRRLVIGRPEDIPAGHRRLVPIPGLGDVGVFNVRGEYFAVKNVCPHQGGPMCVGKLTGTTSPRFTPGERPEMDWVRDGEILRCPWHGWEFDIRTGAAIFSDRTRISTYDVHVTPAEDPGYVPPDAETYPVTVEEQWLVLEVPGAGMRPRSASPDAETEE